MHFYLPHHCLACLLTHIKFPSHYSFQISQYRSRIVSVSFFLSRAASKPYFLHHKSDKPHRSILHRELAIAYRLSPGISPSSDITQTCRSRTTHLHSHSGCLATPLFVVRHSYAQRELIYLARPTLPAAMRFFPYFDFLGDDSIQKVMSDPPQVPAGDDSNSQYAQIFGAFGAVLGYIGAEAATAVTFERLLWPQRTFSNFQWRSVPTMALFMPMGGPMHKVALAVLDRMFSHGLMKGPHQGHMLGTSFFPEQGWTYTMHDDCDGHKAHTEPLRNCIWARALSQIPMLAAESSRRSQSPGQIEKGAPASPQVLRARVAVSHLTFSKATDEDKRLGLPFVWEDTKTPSPRVFLAILTSELIGIAVVIGVFCVFRSLWALLWLLPLFVRLVSAVSALHREKLISAISSSTASDPSAKFEVHCPRSEGNFMLLSGPPALVLQFFRHYGHPRRDRVREVVQLLCVIVLGCQFPIELLCSMIWMPIEIQYVWLTYYLWVVITMHITRYCCIGHSATTEAKIAQAFAGQVRGSGVPASAREGSILFGHQSDGPQTLRVDLSVTYHDRNQDGRDRMAELLEGSTGDSRL